MTFITFASSLDPRYPPQNVLSKDKKTFWVTNGAFPQELIITMEPKILKNIILRTINGNFCLIYLVRQYRLEISSSLSPTAFTLIDEKILGRLKRNDMEIQESSIYIPDTKTSVLHVKITFISGFRGSEFVAVHSVDFE